MQKNRLAYILSGAACILLIVALLFGISRERNRSASVSCRSNLLQIDGAKQTWALDHHKSTNDIPDWNDIIGKYIRETPKCPQGGSYTIGKVGDLPLCSHPGHVLKL